MKKASVIIQARMGSSRLPDKVLMPLAGKPVLEHVIRRCQHAKLVDRVIVATTVDSQDVAVVNFVGGLGVAVYRGSVNDVLDRYYQAAKLFGLRHIIRITADCPAMDPDIIDRVVAEYFRSGADYAANVLQHTYPDGEDVEIFSFDVLSQAWHNAKIPSEREHVTPYMLKNNFLKKTNVNHDVNCGHCRWTLDEPRDYQKLSKIFDALYEKDDFFHMNDVMRFLEAHPEIDGINTDIARNEGYRKSLINDRIIYLAAGSMHWGMGHLKRSGEIIDLLKQQGREIYSLAYVPADFDHVCLGSALKPFDRIIRSWNEWVDFDAKGCIVDLPVDLQESFFVFAKKILKPPVVAIEWYLDTEGLIVDSVNLREGREGLKFAIIRRDILAQAKRQNTQRYDYIMMLGGRDQKGYVREILRLFQQISHLRSKKVAIILGPMDERAHSMRGIDLPGMDVYKDPPDLAELMASARIGISNAGSSLVEMCALGLPTIIFPQTQQEEDFTGVFVGAGCSIKGRLEKDIFFNQLNELWSDHQLWSERSAKARLLIDGQGTQRMVDRINRTLSN